MCKQPPKEPETPQQQALAIVEDLEGLSLEIADAREIKGKQPPSERVLALIADTQSLAEGIASNAIKVSQPRMARNLIETVADLEKDGHYSLASKITNVIRWISTNGLAAENCDIGRRIGLKK